MVIGGVLYDSAGARIQDVIVTLAEPTPAPGQRREWSGNFDLEPHAAALLMHEGASLLLRLQDGREGWCALREVDFTPGALTGFRGTGALEVPAVPCPQRRLGDLVR